MKILKVSELVSIKRSIEAGTSEQQAVVKKKLSVKFGVAVTKR